jgi:parallel beta-helix repeat protein
MSRKLVLLTIVTMIIIGMLGLPFRVQRVKASGTIYIRADGSIDGPANITTVDYVTYYFNESNYDEIVVERSNIIIDGNGYTLQRSGWEWGSGLSLHSVSNVTIRNTNIHGFGDGIYLNSASNNVISRNNIANNSDGIILEYSSNNSITENNITANNGYSGPAPSPNFGYGIKLYDSSNNFLRNNTLIDNDLNFGVLGSTLHDFVNDVDVSNSVDGKPVCYWVNRSDAEVPSDAGYVVLVNCTNVNVENLTLAKNMQGMLLAYTNYSTISENDVANSWNGIMLFNSSSNVIRGNSLGANYGLGIGLTACSNNTISKNHVTATDYFGIYLSQSSNNTISGINVVTNSMYGIVLLDSSDNSLSRNNMANNFGGIGLGQSTTNTVSGNNVTANNGYGITLANSSENLIYNNNFVNNTQHVHIETSGYANFWDDGVEGNYWSDYNGTDSDNDGVGDKPYEIDENNADRFPLMGEFHKYNIWYIELGFTLTLISNSTISNFDVAIWIEHPEYRTIFFDVAGETGYGFCRLCIPKSLMAPPYTVTIDNGQTPVTYYNETLFDNGTHRWIYFAYLHSEHQVEIIPEFPSFLILPLFMIATLLAVIIYRRKHSV